MGRISNVSSHRVQQQGAGQSRLVERGASVALPRPDVDRVKAAVYREPGYPSTQRQGQLLGRHAEASASQSPTNLRSAPPFVLGHQPAICSALLGGCETREAVRVQAPEADGLTHPLPLGTSPPPATTIWHRSAFQIPRALLDGPVRAINRSSFELYAPGCLQSPNIGAARVSKSATCEGMASAVLPKWCGRALSGRFCPERRISRAGASQAAHHFFTAQRSAVHNTPYTSSVAAFFCI